MLFSDIFESILLLTTNHGCEEKLREICYTHQIDQYSLILNQMTFSRIARLAILERNECRSPQYHDGDVTNLAVIYVLPPINELS